VVLEQQKRCSKTLPSFSLTPWSCLLHRVLELRCFARKLGRVGGVQLWSHAHRTLDIYHCKSITRVVHMSK
jgi:hypothetical protein